MNIKLPLNGKWTQLNLSDKFGSISYSKNINLDKAGYLSLSPRMVALFDDSGSVANVSDTDFDIPVAFGRYSNGDFRLATTDEPFNMSVGSTTKTIAEDTSSNNPNLTFNSHGLWWQNKWHETTANNLRSNASGTWSTDLITNLSSSTTRHYMAVFRNKNSLAISDANTVKLYDSSYTLTTTLTIPSDYEIIGLAYNNYQLGILTRLGNDTEGQNAESYFFVWDGATTEAGTGIGIGSYTAMVVHPYKSSFLLIDSSGRLLYFNGGGFDKLAQFPFYLEEQRWGDLLNHLSYGDNIVTDGDVIYINIGLDLWGNSAKGEEYSVNSPSGVWCYDPEAGLYPRYSPSISKSYAHNITQANVNLTTDIFTTSSVIPPTGNPILLVSGTVGGLTNNKIYYIIRLTSTTFKIATTKQNAIDLVAVNITSADTNNYFWTYDIIDYGISYYTISGAVGLWGTTSSVFTDIIMGARLLNTSLTSQPTLCTAVPFLENRGCFVLPKLYLNSVTELVKKIYIKHLPLDINDSIIVKVKDTQYLGIPTTTPNNASLDEITWTSSTTGTTTTDLSEAKAVFDAISDNGQELELELTAGIGAGQFTKIVGLTESSGTYTITTEDEIIGYSSGLKSFFVIDNWKYFDSVQYSNQKNGVFEVSIGKESSGMDIKIELRGYQTTIADITIVTENFKPNE